MTNFLARIPASVQSQAKAFLGGLVAAVAAAEAPLVQGGHWSLTTLYAAAVSAVVGYGLVYFKKNGPSEVNALLALLVQNVAPAVDSGRHVVVVTDPAVVAPAPVIVNAPPLPEPIAVPAAAPAVVDVSAVIPVGPAPTV